MLTTCELCNESTKFTYKTVWIGPTGSLVLPLCKSCLAQPGGLEGYESIELPRPGYGSSRIEAGDPRMQSWIMDLYANNYERIHACEHCVDVPAWPAYSKKDGTSECIGRFCKRCLTKRLLVADVMHPVHRPFDYVIVHNVKLQEARLAMWMLEEHPVVIALLRNI